jgi:hypothetical protein
VYAFYGILSLRGCHPPYPSGQINRADCRNNGRGSAVLYCRPPANPASVQESASPGEFGEWCLGSAPLIGTCSVVETPANRGHPAAESAAGGKCFVGYRRWESVHGPAIHRAHNRAVSYSAASLARRAHRTGLAQAGCGISSRIGPCDRPLLMGFFDEGPDAQDARP